MKMTKIVIEVALAHGCSKCSKAVETVSGLVGGRKDVTVTEVNIAENPEFAIRHSIMSTPAIIINGKLEFRGIPKGEEFERALQKHKG